MCVLHGHRLCHGVVVVLIVSIAIWIPDIFMISYLKLESGDLQDWKYGVFRITLPPPPPLLTTTTRRYARSAVLAATLMAEKLVEVPVVSASSCVLHVPVPQIGNQLVRVPVVKSQSVRCPATFCRAERPNSIGGVKRARGDLPGNLQEQGSAALRGTTTPGMNTTTGTTASSMTATSGTITLGTTTDLWHVFSSERLVPGQCSTKRGKIS